MLLGSSSSQFTTSKVFGPIWCSCKKEAEEERLSEGGGCKSSKVKSEELGEESAWEDWASGSGKTGFDRLLKDKPWEVW